MSVQKVAARRYTISSIPELISLFRFYDSRITRRLTMRSGPIVHKRFSCYALDKEYAIQNMVSCSQITICDCTSPLTSIEVLYRGKETNSSRNNRGYLLCKLCAKARESHLLMKGWVDVATL